MSGREDFNLIIDPKSVQKEYVKDLFRYRELIYFFVWRDILVRYKQTFLGIAWAVIRPLINMAIFVLVFGKIANLSSDGINYPLFVLTAMLPWQLFSTCFVDSSTILLNNAPIISKVYFPRIILPLNCIIMGLVDYLIGLVMVFGLFVYTGVLNYSTLIFLPLLILLTILLSLGVSLWLSALTVRFRDLRFLVPFIIQFGIFLSPVGYGSFLVSEKWHWAYFMNPMAGIIEGFRWSFFGIYHSYLPYALITSVALSFVLLYTGFMYFRKMERVIADII